MADWCRVLGLGVRAGRVFADPLLSGLSRSRERGLGVEYIDFRDYVYGDDIRYVDWRLSARRVNYNGEPRLVVKLFEAERLVEPVFIVDLTASMGFGEKPWMLGYASMVLGSLAASLEDRATLVALSDEVRVFAPRSPREIPLVIENIVCRGGGFRGSIGLDKAAERLGARGYRPVVVVTDYGHGVGEVYRFLRSMRARRNRVYTVMLLDRYEVEEPVDNAVVELVDPESGVAVRGRLSSLYEAARLHVAKVRSVARHYSSFFLELVGRSDCLAKRARIIEGYLYTRSGLIASC